MNKEVRKLVQSLTPIPGVEVTETGSGHLMVTRDGAFVTTLPSTPSDVRWRENALAQLRRAGITPGVRPPKSVPPPVRTVDLRAELKPIRDAKQIAQFAKFAQQLGEIRGLRIYKNTNSAESSIGEFVRGGNLSGWSARLIAAALVEWRRREPEQRVVERIAASLDMPAQEPDPASVKLVVDLSRLASKLAEFGIELEVR